MFDPKSSRTTGYHLFIEPTGTVADMLSGIIQTFAKEYGGPVFLPHITLLARIPIEDEVLIIKKSQKFAESLSPFSLTFGTIGMEDRYFRALYILIQEIELMCAYHDGANKIFDMHDEGVYGPHLSLLYGNYSADKKQKTIDSLQPLQGISFLVDKIHLYKTEGEVQNWHKIQELPLGK